MKLHNAIKRILSVIMIFAILFGGFVIPGSRITAKASDNPVQMYAFDRVRSSRGYVQCIVYIQIDAGSASNKSVYVHHNTYESGWVDEPATYLTNLDDNTEIWKAAISGNVITEFAIKYIGDNQTYWDNNNGNNYSLNSSILGTAKVKAERTSYQSPDSYNIVAVVKNLAYNKIVKVRYTQDNWATYQDADLSYASSISGTDSERWSTTLNLDENKMDDFHYCIYYQVNGQTYWDNNFGENYDSTYRINQ